MRGNSIEKLRELHTSRLYARYSSALRIVSLPSSFKPASVTDLRTSVEADVQLSIDGDWTGKETTVYPFVCEKDEHKEIRLIILQTIKLKNSLSPNLHMHNNGFSESALSSSN